MKGFVKLYLCHAQKRLKNVINTTMEWQNCKTKFIKSSAKFTCIKLRPCLNNHKSFETIDLVEVT